MTLDEIYESFIWEASYTNEEYESKITAGINEAKKYKYLYPFIQPIIPEHSKIIWAPCARVIELKSNEEIQPYLPLLLKWLQDINWPGAYTIMDRLAKMPFSMLEKCLDYSKKQAEEENDELWLYGLNELEEKLSGIPPMAE